jgi:Uncharacterised protein family (UPF0261)
MAHQHASAAAGAGRATAPWARPATDGVFVDLLKRHFPNGAIREFDHHINDAAFADACVEELIGLLSRARAEPLARAHRMALMSFAGGQPHPTSSGARS